MTIDVPEFSPALNKELNKLVRATTSRINKGVMSAGNVRSFVESGLKRIASQYHDKAIYTAGADAVADEINAITEPLHWRKFTRLDFI